MTFSQVIGLLPSIRDTKSLKLRKSRFWYCYYILIFILFAILFPMTVYLFYSKSKQWYYGLNESINMIYFGFIYIFTICAYAEQLYNSNFRRDYFNTFVRLNDRIFEITSDYNVGRQDLLWFLFRTFYLYFGYGYLTIIEINRHEEAPKYIWFCQWFSFLMPIFVSGCGMLWIHVLTVFQINSLRKMRKAFSNCIDMANSTVGLTPGRQHIICCRANDKFDRISELYTVSYNLNRKILERGPFIMIAVLIKIFVLMSTVFYSLYDEINKGTWTTPQKIHLIHMTIRLLFNYLDLQFMCSLSNTMQKEYEKIGLAIQKGFLVRIPKSFQRSVSNSF